MNRDHRLEEEAARELAAALESSVLPRLRAELPCGHAQAYALLDRLDRAVSAATDSPAFEEWGWSDIAEALAAFSRLTDEQIKEMMSAFIEEWGWSDIAEALAAFSRPTDEQIKEAMSAAGSWVGLVDCEELMRSTYEARKSSSLPRQS